MFSRNLLKHAIAKSSELAKVGDLGSALSMLDEALSKAIEEGAAHGIGILAGHAAILCEAHGERNLVKHYYERWLVHVPDSPHALYGLSKALLEEGQTEEARHYALKCLRAVSQAGDDGLRRALLEMVAVHWPSLKADGPIDEQYN